MNMIEKLELLMADNGISDKAALSRISGIAYTTLDGLWKKGTENVKRGTLKKLADTLGCTMDYLADDDQSTYMPKSASIDEIIELMHKNPKLGILFSRSAKMSEKSLDAVLSIVELMDKEGKDNE